MLGPEPAPIPIEDAVKAVIALAERDPHTSLGETRISILPKKEENESKDKTV